MPEPPAAGRTAARVGAGAGGGAMAADDPPPETTEERRAGRTRAATTPSRMLRRATHPVRSASRNRGPPVHLEVGALGEPDVDRRQLDLGGEDPQPALERFDLALPRRQRRLDRDDVGRRRALPRRARSRSALACAVSRRPSTSATSSVTSSALTSLPIARPSPARSASTASNRSGGTLSVSRASLRPPGRCSGRTRARPPRWRLRPPGRGPGDRIHPHCEVGGVDDLAGVGLAPPRPAGPAAARSAGLPTGAATRARTATASRRTRSPRGGRCHPARVRRESPPDGELSRNCCSRSDHQIPVDG